MSVSVAHFLIWLVLLGGLPPILLRVAAGRLRTDRPMARLNLCTGPALLGLVWLHGVLFDPPNNWAVLRAGSRTSYAPDGTLLSSSPGMTFFEFWFKPFRALDWSPERVHAALWLGVPAVAWLVLALFRAWRVRRLQLPAKGETRGVLGYLSWVLAALLLRHIPDAMMDTPETVFGESELSSEVFWYTFGAPLLTAAVPLVVAVILSRARPGTDSVRAGST